MVDGMGVARRHDPPRAPQSERHRCSGGALLQAICSKDYDPVGPMALNPAVPNLRANSIPLHG